METTGVLSMALVDHVFSEYDKHGLVREDILNMMEQFGLIVKFKSPTNIMYFVPCQVKTPPKPICEMEPSPLDPSPLYLHFPAGFSFSIPGGISPGCTILPGFPVPVSTAVSYSGEVTSLFLFHFFP